MLKHLFLAPATEGSPAAGGAPAAAPPPAAAAPPAAEPKKEDAPAKTLLESATDTPDPAKTPAPTDSKPGDATAKQGEKKDGEAAKAEPIDIKLPEGFSADPALLDEFKKLASESGLKSDVAQKLVDFQAKLNAAAKAQQDKEAADFNAKETAWISESKKIPAAELGLAKRAMLHFTKDLPPALQQETRDILQTTWMGNHPGVLRLLAKAGAFVAEDRLAEEGTAGRAPTGPASAQEMYPSMKKKA
jgi:hypothetical protein